jgi:hypothetical protein
VLARKMPISNANPTPPSQNREEAMRRAMEELDESNKRRAHHARREKKDDILQAPNVKPTVAPNWEEKEAQMPAPPARRARGAASSPQAGQLSRGAQKR